MSCILLIDDEEVIAFGLRRFFEKKGYDFIGACTGREGLETALRELPTLCSSIPSCLTLNGLI